MKKLLLLLTFLSCSAWAETPSDATDTQIDKLSNNCPTGWDPTNLTKIKNCMAVNHEDRIDTLEAEFSAIMLDGWRELTGAPVRIREQDGTPVYNWHNDHWDDTLGRHIDKDWLSPWFTRNRSNNQLDKRKIKYTWIGASIGYDEFPEVGPYDQRVYYTTTDCTPVAGGKGYLDNDKIGINHGWPVFDLGIDGAFGTFAMDLITSEVQLGPIEGSSRVELFWYQDRRPSWYEGSGECVPTTLDGTYWSIDIWEPMAGNKWTQFWWVDY